MLSNIFKPFLNTVWEMEQPWISLFQNQSDITVIEKKVDNHNINCNRAPYIISFVGGTEKNIVLSHLLKGAVTSYSSCIGSISLNFDKRIVNDDCPILAVNCQLQRDSVVERPALKTGLPRRLHWSSERRRSSQDKSVNNLLYGNVLAPFSFVTCYFSADLRGLKGVATLLAEQIIQSKIAHLLPGMLPRCLVVVESRSKYFDACEIEQKLHLRIHEAMRSIRDYSSIEEIEIDIAAHIHSIRVIGVQKSWDITLRVKCIRNRLLVLCREAKLDRQRKGVLFSYKHFQGLVGPLLDHFCSNNMENFSFILSSRPCGSYREEFTSHLRELLTLLPLKDSWWQIAIPLTSSALFLDANPPGSHGKQYFKRQEA